MDTQMQKEVRFDIWCQSCEHRDVKDEEGKDPCNTCLTTPARIYTTKPINYKESTG